MKLSKNLLIEGWRGINHSFAMINQYQIRELLKNNKAISFIEKNFTWRLISKKLSDLFIND